MAIHLECRDLKRVGGANYYMMMICVNTLYMIPKQHRRDQYLLDIPVVK